MTSRTVTLNVPPEAQFARTVRMTAANLAVCCGMNVDDVEDVRIAAEEGFVYACATRPQTCDIAFELASDKMDMDFTLGEEDPDEASDASGEPQPIDLIEVLLDAVCDDYSLGPDGMTLHLSKKIGAENA
ncbi:MAG: ATP-binding protein [Tractidigestivibacter sp.]|uniref:ATP-binding protein n=1 Tax=Tractidigestivibacter sp. TaxID=2847320 RepID=UPI003D8DB112